MLQVAQRLQECYELIVFCIEETFDVQIKSFLVNHDQFRFLACLCCVLVYQFRELMYVMANQASNWRVLEEHPAVLLAIFSLRVTIDAQVAFKQNVTALTVQSFALHFTLTVHLPRMLDLLLKMYETFWCGSQ